MSAPPAPSTVGDLSEGWLYILLGGAGWVLAMFVAYLGATHATGGLVVVGAVIGFASVVATAIGVIAEGIGLARRHG